VSSLLRYILTTRDSVGMPSSPFPELGWARPQSKTSYGLGVERTRTVNLSMRIKLFELAQSKCIERCSSIKIIKTSLPE
jgi:hypothetical protein